MSQEYFLTSLQSTQNLQLYSPLQELGTIDFQVDENCTGGQLLQEFQSNPLLPGVILTRQGLFCGIISRVKFIAMLSRPFGRELFLHRPLSSLLVVDPAITENVTILPAHMPIFEAVRVCLQRSAECLYEPIVVDLGQSTYQLLALHDLLVAQTQIYQFALVTIEERNTAITAQNEQMRQYIQQVETMTAAAVAVENNTFQPGDLQEVASRGDELGRLARVFQEMVRTVKIREQQLAEAKEQLEAILNAVPGSISWVDSGGIYMGVNRHLSESWNLPQDAFIGKEVGFLKGNTQFADFTREFLSSSDQSASQVLEMHIGGTLKYYLVASQKYLQGNAAVSVGFDITDRKQAELALIQSEERFRSLVSNLTGAVYRYHCQPNWTLEYISDAIELISGYAATDLIEHQVTYTHLIHPEDRDLVEVIINHGIVTQEPYILDYRIVHPDGSIRWVYEQGQAVFDSEGNPLYLDGVIFDVTERKQAEEALRIAEENYRSIFENALEGIFQSSPTGQYFNVNPAMAKLYGYDSPSEMISSITNIDEQLYVDAEQRIEFRHLMEIQGTAKDFEYRCYRKDGSITWVQVDARAVRDSHGNLLYYEGLVQDISDRKQREEALQRQLEELKIEIDQKKREQDVALLTQDSFFQELQAEIAQVNLDEFWS